MYNKQSITSKKNGKAKFLIMSRNEKTKNRNIFHLSMNIEQDEVKLFLNYASQFMFRA